MNINKYLMQIRFLNRKIRRLRADIEILREHCDSCAIELDPNKVQKSRNFSNPIDYVIDKERELNDAIREVDNKRSEIIKMIELIDNVKAYEVVYMYYVQEYEMKTICEILDITYSWGYKLKKIGIDTIRQKRTQ